MIRSCSADAVCTQQDEHQHAAAAAAESDGRHEMDCAHLATTYTALCTLRVLGDDFSRLDRAAILSAIKHLQQPDGRSPPHALVAGSLRCALTVCRACGGKVQLQCQRGRQRE
jgi:prenyltransferase beta subunit